jgi:hypothetical protein
MSPEARILRSLCPAMLLATAWLLTADSAFARRKIPETPLPPGPGLQEMVEELQKPLPPLDQSDARHLQTLAKPPELASDDPDALRGRAFGLMIYGSLLLFGWCIAFGKLPALPELAIPRGLRVRVRLAWPQIQRRVPTETPAVPRKPPRSAPVRTAQVSSPKPQIVAVPATAATAQSNAPEPLSNSQIIHYKALSSFDSWRELLTAARAGNRVAREVLDASPSHAAVKFRLTAEDFTRDFAWVRNVVLSRAWVSTILALLRGAERFDESLTITNPFGRRQELLLDAPIDALNAVLGYESLPPATRRQLELRRWILWQTRTDGAENPEVLAPFAAAPPMKPPATADALAAKAAAAMRS